MSQSPILASLDARGIATVILNRPEVNNAYNDALIEGILAGLDRLEADPNLRAVVLKGNGRHFQAGADLKWINAVRQQGPEANHKASHATATAIDRLNRLTVPVVALVHGGCFGGGTGMVAAADVVIASDDAVFSIAEVRWGLHAGIIIPHLIDAIGVRNVRRYALTGERFDAAEAGRIGLVHEVVPRAALESRGAAVVDAILENAPDAMRQTKQHILEHAEGGLERAVLDALVTSHAAARQTEEAAEGLASFAEKRRAKWAPAKL